MAKKNDREHLAGRNLVVAILLNVGIMLAQVIGGLVSGSLALLADAVHNGSDAAALGIAYGARRTAQRRADLRLTFGYRRAELIGAMINLTVLFVIALYLLYESVRRFVDPPEVGGVVMIAVGAIAFVEDGISAWLLYRGQRGSRNIRAAFIHMMADTLSSVGVVVGGILILTVGLVWIDPLLTAGIAVYIIVSSYSEIRKTIAVLMESAPPGFDLNAMVAAVESLDGVSDVHHVHVWQLDEKRVALEAHVAVKEDDLERIETLKGRIKQLLHDEYDIGHATLEIEPAGLTGHARDV
ncbi:MAG: cation diffusion facilitator family transporter, partial [Bacteroidota bacterium]